MSYDQFTGVFDMDDMGTCLCVCDFIALIHI